MLIAGWNETVQQLMARYESPMKELFDHYCAVQGKKQKMPLDGFLLFLRDFALDMWISKASTKQCFLNSWENEKSIVSPSMASTTTSMQSVNDKLIGFIGFQICLFRCATVAFGVDGKGNELSSEASLITLFCALDESEGYKIMSKRSGVFDVENFIYDDDEHWLEQFRPPEPKPLPPDDDDDDDDNKKNDDNNNNNSSGSGNAASSNNNNSDNAAQQQQQQPTFDSNDALIPTSLESLPTDIKDGLQQIFHHYQQQESPYPNRISLRGYNAFVRDCNLSQVNTEDAADVIKQCLKTSQSATGSNPSVGFRQFCLCVVGLGELEFDLYSGNPVVAVTRMLKERILRNNPMFSQVKVDPEPVEPIKQSQQQPPQPPPPEPNTTNTSSNSNHSNSNSKKVDQEALDGDDGDAETVASESVDQSVSSVKDKDKDKKMYAQLVAAMPPDLDQYLQAMFQKHVANVRDADGQKKKGQSLGESRFLKLIGECGWTDDKLSSDEAQKMFRSIAQMSKKGQPRLRQSYFYRILLQIANHKYGAPTYDNLRNLLFGSSQQQASLQQQASSQQQASQQQGKKDVESDAEIEGDVDDPDAVLPFEETLEDKPLAKKREEVKFADENKTEKSIEEKKIEEEKVVVVEEKVAVAVKNEIPAAVAPIVEEPPKTTVPPTTTVSSTPFTASEVSSLKYNSTESKPAASFASMLDDDDDDNDANEPHKYPSSHHKNDPHHFPTSSSATRPTSASLAHHPSHQQPSHQQPSHQQPSQHSSSSLIHGTTKPKKQSQQKLVASSTTPIPSAAAAPTLRPNATRPTSASTSVSTARPQSAEKNRSQSAEKKRPQSAPRLSYGNVKVGPRVVGPHPEAATFGYSAKKQETPSGKSSSSSLSASAQQLHHQSFSPFGSPGKVDMFKTKGSNSNNSSSSNHHKPSFTEQLDAMQASNDIGKNAEDLAMMLRASKNELLKLEDEVALLKSGKHHAESRLEETKQQLMDTILANRRVRSMLDEARNQLQNLAANSKNRPVRQVTSTPRLRPASPAQQHGDETSSEISSSTVSRRKRALSPAPMRFSMDKDPDRRCTPLRMQYRVPSPARRRDDNFQPIPRSVAQVKTFVGLGTMSLVNCQLTSLVGLGVQPDLRSLYLQNNFLTSLVGLEMQPRMKELHLEDNRIVCFRGACAQPSLENLWMKNNPITAHEFFNSCCLLAFGSSLLRIDDRGILPKEREESLRMGQAVAEAVHAGWLPDSVERTANELKFIIQQHNLKYSEQEKMDAAEAANRQKAGVGGGKGRSSSVPRGTTTSSATFGSVNTSNINNNNNNNSNNNNSNNNDNSNNNNNVGDISSFKTSVEVEEELKRWKSAASVERAKVSLMEKRLKEMEMMLKKERERAEVLAEDRANNASLKGNTNSNSRGLSPSPMMRHGYPDQGATPSWKILDSGSAAALVKENERLLRDNAVLMARCRALSSKSNNSNNSSSNNNADNADNPITAATSNATVEQLQNALKSYEAKVSRLESKLGRAFAAEDLVRLSYLHFRGFKFQANDSSEKHNAFLVLTDDGIAVFDLQTQDNLMAVVVEEDVQILPTHADGFRIVAPSAGSGLLEHKQAGIIGRLAKLWMAFKKERKALQGEDRFLRSAVSAASSSASSKSKQQPNNSNSSSSNNGNSRNKTSNGLYKEEFFDENAQPCPPVELDPKIAKGTSMK